MYTPAGLLHAVNCLLMSSMTLLLLYLVDDLFDIELRHGICKQGHRDSVQSNHFVLVSFYTVGSNLGN
jgi:hypothetical protein